MAGPLGLAISIGAPVSVGQPLGACVTLTNRSDAPVWVVGVLDGSEPGVRFPQYRPSIEGPAPVAPEQIEFDMLAPLRPLDFLRLSPGESCDPTVGPEGSAWLPLYTFANFRPPVGGRYRLGLVLSTLSDDPAEWLGGWEAPGRAEAVALLAGVPRVRVEASVSFDVAG